MNLLFLALALLVFSSECLFLCHWVWGYFLCSFLPDSMYLVLFWGLSNIWSWVLCRVVSMILFEFFSMQSLSLNSSTCWRVFFLVYAFLFLIKSQGPIGVELCPCVQFNFIAIHSFVPIYYLYFFFFLWLCIPLGDQD